MPETGDRRDLPWVPERGIEELGGNFYDPVEPARFPERKLRFRNQPWAERVGLGGLDAEAWERHFAGFEPLPGSLPGPLAIRYHGHQFRNYNPHLGDGRGFLFAQVRDPVDGRLLDLGTKGSGRTPYSRGGDGRLTLKGAVREVLATEMLEARGVNTSRTLSVIETGESLVRHDEPSPTRAAVLVRLSHSHVRFGCFQYQEYQRHPERVLELVHYCCRHYFPWLLDLPPRERLTEFLREVVARGARFVAELMQAGFVHGVLNTDNCNVTGESFDYGPYRFAPHFDPGFVAAYFDHTGLYAFGRQAEALRWNLGHLARVLEVTCPVLCDREGLRTALKEFWPRFEAEFQRRLLGRLGVRSLGDEGDRDLVDALTRFLTRAEVGLAQFFHDWYGGGCSQSRAEAGPARGIYRESAFADLRHLLLGADPEPGVEARLGHDYFQGEAPCTLLIDEVEAIWDPIARDDDWDLFEAKVQAIRVMGEAHGQGAASFRGGTEPVARPREGLSGPAGGSP